MLPEITQAMRTRFRKDGFIIIPGAVEPGRIATMRMMLSEAMKSEPGTLPQVYTRNIIFTDQGLHQQVIDFYASTGVHVLANQLLSSNNPAPLPDFVQAAVTFPPYRIVPTPHVDGLLMQREDGSTYVGPNTFSLLCGMVISDQTGDQGGLTVWPGSHTILADHIRRRGIGIMRDETCFKESGRTYPADIPLPDPLQLAASPGSVIFCHYLLAHCPGSHVAEAGEIRHTLYYRLYAHEHQRRSIQTLTDPMLEFS